MIRRLARGTAVVAVALAAGHLVQTLTAEQQAQSDAAPRPTGITPVSAGPEAVAMPSAAVTVIPPAPEAEAAPLLAATTPDLPLPPPLAPPVLQLAPAESPVVATPAPAVTNDCTPRLDLMAEAHAMIGLTLVAPCNADERVVLRHAGLAVTARTTATGSLFVSLPALTVAADVSVLFGDQTTADASIRIPEAATLRRFGVQWMAEDSFQVQALENGARYGGPGHVSASAPGLADAAGGGWLSLLGDATTDMPMLAQVYTYPADPKAQVEVIVEAAVTDATCNRDLLGETLTSVGGDTYVTDLTVATPPCDAVGDILVLKNLVPDLKIAAN